MNTSLARFGYVVRSRRPRLSPMQAGIWTAAWLGVVAAWLGPVAVGAEPIARNETPTHLPAEIWAKLAPQLERVAYAFSPDGRARNRTQDFTLAAARRGLTVNERLRLRAVALNGMGLRDVEPVVREQRIEYRYAATGSGLASSTGSRLARSTGSGLTVVEWYENRSEGLEQGFEIGGPEIGDGRPARLELRIGIGGLKDIAVAADGRSARLTDAEGREFGYGELKARDATGRDLPVGLQRVSPTSLDILCDTRQATFPISIDPLLTSMTTKLTATDKAASDFFGYAVSVAGDVAVVGASQASPGGVTNAGAAYVFERSVGGANAWGQVAKLTAADKATSDHFGYAVSVGGDVAVVGAYYASPGGLIGAGAAYVFERNVGGTNGWGQVAKLTAADKAEGDWFGYAVSVAGDVAVVGAFYASPGGVSGAGAAYVFERNVGGTNGWGQVAKLTAADKAGGDNFGQSVSVGGDVAVVGAAFASPGGLSGAGAAYVFERNIGGTNGWGQVAKLTAADKATYASFGSSVSVAGDVALVGADGASPGGLSSAGAAYVFERNVGGTNGWGQVAKLTAADKAAGNWFGHAVSVAGDVALVGAFYASPGGLGNAGAAYVFERNAGGTNAWGQVAKLTATDKAAGNWFGHAVSLAGDVALVGADGASPGGTSQAGAAYVIPLSRAQWTPSSQLTATDKAASDYFGYAVSAAGDVALVGAYQADPGAVTNAGAVYVFERNGGGTNAWGQVAKLIAADKAASNYFGYAASVAGDVAVVGAYGADPGGVANAGAAYVFERNAGGTNAWGQVAKLIAGDKAANDYFGYAVSVAGDVALVGAYGADPGGLSSAGAAYVFERNAGGTNAWGQAAKLIAGDKAPSDYFGTSVSVAGDVALVGARMASPGGLSFAGAAYVFERNAGGTNAWGQVAKLTGTDKAGSDLFGQSVSVAGDVALIGAYRADLGGMADAGAAYVFERNAGGTNAWGQVAKLTAADKTASDYFGYAVSVAGDAALVGAYYADPGGVADAGAAYVFERNAGGTNAWGQVAKLTAANKAASDCFGVSVSVAGAMALVGAYKADPGGVTDAGAVYVFEGSLYGPPTICNVCRTGAVCRLAFDCQPAWRYDIQSRTNLLGGSWQPAAGLTNLAGDVSGSLTVAHTNDLPTMFYRLLRHAP